MKVSALLTLLLFSMFGCSCTTTQGKEDSQSALEGHDLTAMIGGCGNQIGVGYIVCRMSEGQPAETEFLRVMAPPQLKCESEDCVHFRIYFPDGRPTYGGVLKMGEAEASVPWKLLINKNQFELEDRGFWYISVDVSYLGPKGIEEKAYASGYILMHVTRRNYISLLENPEDEHFYWNWKSGSRTIKMTTGFRVFVSGVSGVSDSIP